jgi:hypothetical protein
MPVPDGGKFGIGCKRNMDVREVVGRDLGHAALVDRFAPATVGNGRLAARSESRTGEDATSRRTQIEHRIDAVGRARRDFLEDVDLRRDEARALPEVHLVGAQPLVL